MNGLARIQRPGREEYTVIYKDDMRIEANNTGLSTGDYIYVILAIGCVLAVFFGALSMLITRSLDNIMILIGAYIFLLCMSCCQSATKYINNLVQLDQVFANIDAAIKEPPTVEFHIACYHMVTKRHKNRTSKVRKYTHRASEKFVIKEWEDRSPPSQTLNFLSVLLVSRLHTDKTIDFSSKASYRFDKQKKVFLKNNTRDKH